MRILLDILYMLIRKSADTDGSQSNYLSHYFKFQKFAGREDMRKLNGLHFLNTEKTLLGDIYSLKPLKLCILYIITVSAVLLFICIPIISIILTKKVLSIKNKADVKINLNVERTNRKGISAKCI